MRMCACRGTAGFAHVSCLAEQAKILVAEAEENNLDHKVKDARFARWDTCSLCEQDYHGIVRCALGWACWKTYLGRPETDWARRLALSVLGNGLSDADRDEEALSVREAELSSLQRLGARAENMLIAQGNLANTYKALRRLEEAIRMRREVYSGWLKLKGDEHPETLREALCYASALTHLNRHDEAKSLLRKTIPAARRVLGEEHVHTLTMRKIYAVVLASDGCATLDDIREAVTTLEEVERIARRVFGGAHPLTSQIEDELRDARRALYARGLP